jgi:germination protein M
MRKTIAAVLFLTLAGAACQKNAPRSGTPVPAPAETATPNTMEVRLWYIVSGANGFFLAPEKHSIPSSQAVAKAALEELIHGKAQDKDHVVPYSPKSQIRSVTIKDQVATVDWSAAVLRDHQAGSEVEALGIQQVVYTLTEFSTIGEVRFTVEGKTRGTASNGSDIESWWGHVGLDGQPFVRADSLENVEPIILWTPAESASSAGTITLRGEVVSPDGSHRDTMAVRLLDASGREVLRTTIYATRDPSGHQPWRLVYEKTIAFTPPKTAQAWTVQIAHLSLKDGSVEFSETRSVRVG